jgi:uridine nucleosidase
MAQALLSVPAGEAWIVATGALTNVALAFQKYPSLIQHVKGVSIMGGAVGNGHTNAQLGTVSGVPRIGNWSAHAEFNILVDPEAADFLLAHPILSKKITLIPLDVSHLVLATPAVQNFLLQGKSGSGETRLRKMLVELLTFFADTYTNVFGISEGPPLHDPIAFAVLLDEVESLGFDFNNGERFEVKVVTAGTHEDALNGSETGRTICSLLPEGEEGVRIPRGLNVEWFWTVIESSLMRADEDNSKTREEDKLQNMDVETGEAC